MGVSTQFVYQTGASLGYSIQRTFDGLYYDFANSVFSASPETQISPLTEGTGHYIGLYQITLTSTPQTVFTDGYYTSYIHNVGSSNVVLALSSFVMIGGSTQGGYSLVTVRNLTESSIDITRSGLSPVRLFGNGSLTIDSGLLDMSGQIATLVAAGSIVVTDD